MKKVYIAGKIKGVEIAEVWNKFYKQEQILKERGFEVVNPLRVVGINSLAEYIHHKEKEWNWYLKKCIEALVWCDEAIFLPCWFDSKGAKLESRLAGELGIERHYL